MSRLCIAVGCLVFFAACTLENAGERPVPGTVNFPKALTIDPSGRYLAVLNSNFDLRFNRGTVMTLDLEAVGAAIAACQAPCTISDLAPLLRAEVEVASHGVSLAWSQSGARLYALLQGDRSVTWMNFDAVSGSLDCGQGQGAECAAAHRSFRQASCASVTSEFLGYPEAMVSVPSGDLGGPPGDAIFVAHQDGRASLLHDSGEGPVLLAQLTGLPFDLSSLAVNRESGTVWTTNKLYSSAAGDRISRSLGRFRVRWDEQLECSDLYRSPSVLVSGLDDGLDNRDLAFFEDDLFLVSRRPEALVTLDLTAPPTAFSALNEQRQPSRSYPLPPGPSRIEVATVGNAPYAFVTSYDSRTVSIIDLDRRLTVAVVPGFAGPFEMAVDTARNLLFVADFRDSVIRVVRLDGLSSGGDVSIVATLGRVRPVQVLR